MAGGLETEWEDPSAASTSGECVIFVLESAQLEVAKVRSCCAVWQTAGGSRRSGMCIHPSCRLPAGRN